MECNIVRDLLPLYIDGLCSEDTCRLLEKHLAECKLCKELYEELDAEINMSVQKEDWEKDIMPLKKIRGKLHRKSAGVIFWSSLFVLLLCVTIILAYGQISKKTVSFEMLYEMCRMQRIGKEFAEGNLMPLYEILDSGYKLHNQESSVLRFVYKSEEEYDKDMLTAIGEKYEQYFGGVELKYEGIEYIEYTGDSFRKFDKTLSVSLKFSAGTEVEYYIALYKTAKDTFLVNDYFGNPYIVFTDNDTEKVSELEADKEKYHYEDSLFGCLPNTFFDYDLAYTRYYVMLAGERRLENDFSLDGKEYLGTLLYSWEDLQNNTQNARKEFLKGCSLLEEKGLVLTDVLWKVKAYDKNLHLYQYDWEMVFKNKNNGLEEVRTLKTYGVGNIFVVEE